MVSSSDTRTLRLCVLPIINVLNASGMNTANVINPLKGKTEFGWHFEQQVYDPRGIARALKAGGGSGNMPKVIIRWC